MYIDELWKLFKSYKDLRMQSNPDPKRGVQVSMDGKMHYISENYKYSDLDDSVKREYDRLAKKFEECNFSCAYCYWDNVTGDLVFRIYFEESKIEYALYKPVLFDSENLVGVYRLERWKGNTLLGTDFFHEEKVLNILKAAK